VKIALSIAGSDPSGAAGLEQDLRVFERFGVHGVAVATALTEQDSARVYEQGIVPPADFRRRLERLLRDLPLDAVKLGMLATSAHVEIVADCLDRWAVGVPLVIDPVFQSSSGAVLLEASGIEVLRERLLSRATWVTPNQDELWALDPSGETTDLEAAAGRLSTRGGRVYVTAGDRSEPELKEFVAEAGRVEVRSSPRLPGPSPHGTGCALAAALAAALARGDGERIALDRAIGFVRGAIAASEIPGRARGARPILVFQGEWS
jgi:hydroxymethylpyrimidine/phosphomethylpyrimidine kinase